MTQVFSKLTGGGEAMAIWYQFSILFIAIFTMAVMDHGTRMAKFFFQETFGWVCKSPILSRGRLSTIVAAGLGTVFWAYLLYTGDIGTIWPTFGICNILLACIGLIVGTSFIVKRSRAIYGIVTFWPIFIFATAAVYGALLKITDELIPSATLPAIVQSGILIIVIILVLLILGDFLVKQVRSRKCIHR
jgi:carbon starvation protein